MAGVDTGVESKTLQRYILSSYTVVQLRTTDSRIQRHTAAAASAAALHSASLTSTPRCMMAAVLATKHTPAALLLLQ